MLDQQRAQALDQLLGALAPVVGLEPSHDLVRARAARLYWQARSLREMAATFHSEPLGRLLQMEALCAARCAAEVFL